MRPRPVHSHRLAVTGLVVLCVAGPVLAESQGRPAVIWVDQAVSAASGTTVGGHPSGPEPGIAFRFIQEQKSGSSPKFEVEDEAGVRWKVKLGEEARAETAATHLLRAVGFLVDDDYYRPEIQVAGLPRLGRGRRFVSPDGVVHGARLEHVGPSAPSHTWSWFENPFVGTREFNGLRVMMALINNWDLKEVNNSAPDEPDGDGRHRVTDLGATFGRTGNVLKRSKGNQADYAGSTFIAHVTATHVDFVLRSRPILLGLYDIRKYRSRTRMERVAKNIPLADARWMGERLARLSHAQLIDCFSSAGFAPADAQGYASAVQRRIAELNALPAGGPSGSDGFSDKRPAADSVSTFRRCEGDTCRQVPVRERVTHFPLGTRHLRVVAGGFEQGAGLGGGIQATTADALPLVELRVTAFTSTRLFRKLELEARVPRVGSDRTHAALRYIDLRRNVDFASIEPVSLASPQTHFALDQRSYQGTLARDLTRDLQSGAYAQVVSTFTSSTGATSDPFIEELFSGLQTGPPQSWIPGLLSRPRILSYGAYLALDTRDDSQGLTRGLSVYARAADARGLGAQPELYGYGWREAEVDVRAHLPLGSPRTSLLARSRVQFKTPKNGGRQIPFYDLSYLGGRTSLRGYHSYRFRANNALLLSAELQRTVRALTPVRGIDLLASADTGQAWGDSRPIGDPRVPASTFNLNNWHTGLGGGLQYRHSRHLAARIEASVSRERTFTYVSLSRGF